MSLYLLFAATTAIVAHLELVSPVIGDLIALDTENGITENKWLTYFVFVLIHFIAAPAVILACLIPSIGTRFRNALFNELRKV